MLRARLALTSALLLCAAPFATTSSQAIVCTPEADDVCATYTFACERLAYHNVYLGLCHLA